MPEQNQDTLAKALTAEQEVASQDAHAEEAGAASDADSSAHTEASDAEDTDEVGDCDDQEEEDDEEEDSDASAASGSASTKGQYGEDEEEEENYDEEELEEDEDEEYLSDEEEDEHGEDDVDISARPPLQYLPSFLLEFKDRCTEVPDGLDSKLKMIVGRQNQHQRGNSRRRNQNNRSPGSGTPGRQPRGSKRDQGPRQNRTKQSAQLKISDANIKPLTQSENAWTRPTKKAESESEENEAVLRKAQGLLNRVTVENFDSLKDEIFALGTKNEEILRGLIERIFDKAVLEKHFCPLYAKLCKYIQWKIQEANTNNAEESVASVLPDFRRLLLARCQQAFTTKPVTKEFTDEMTEEEREDVEYENTMAKKTYLGNVVFIGELYKKGMLQMVVMHFCLKDLMKRPSEEAPPSDDSLETLHTLLSTIGYVLEDNEVKESKDAKAEHSAMMDERFAQIAALAEDPQVGLRVRFMMRDLLDMRKKGWESRRKIKGPKKIKEIHREAQLADAKKEQESRANLRRSGGGGGGGHHGNRNRRNDWSGSQGGNPRRGLSSSQEGWETQGGKRGGSGRNNSRSRNGRDSRDGGRGDMRGSSGAAGGEDDGWSVAGSGRASRQGGQSRRGGGSGNTWRGSRGNSREPDGHSGSGGGGGGGRRWGSQSQDRSNSRDGSSSRYQPAGGRRTPSSTEEDHRTNMYAALGDGMGEPSSKSSRGSSSQKRGSSDRLSSSSPHDAARAGPSSPSSSSSSSSKAMKSIPALTAEQLDRKADAIIDELLISSELEEAIECVAELAAPDFHPEFVNKAVLKALDGTEPQRVLVDKLLTKLCAANTLTASHLGDGYGKVIAALPDFAIDLPLAPAYFAHFVSASLSRKHLESSFLKQVFSSVDPDLISGGAAIKFTTVLLSDVLEATDEANVKSLVSECGLEAENLVQNPKMRNKDGLRTYWERQAPALKFLL